MNSCRDFMKCCAALLALGMVLTPAAGRTDTLYIGDADDNTIKAFDASDNFKPLWTSDYNNVSGLRGPRGIVLSGRELLVVNQNVGLDDVAGEVLRYDATTGKFLDPLITFSDPDAPYAPDGIVLGLGGNDLFVANMLRMVNVTPGRVHQYADDGTLLAKWKVKNNEHQPRGVVVGPDGDLYVSARDFKKGLGGTVLRFSPDGKAEVFIDDKGGPGQLNRPDGLVFGSDGRLYVTSFRADSSDTDSIRIYDANGDFADKIDLYDAATGPRAYAQSLLFGPDGKLFVPINNTGEVRRYNELNTGDYTVIVPAGPLVAPFYMTFGRTNPSTLTYDN